MIKSVDNEFELPSAEIETALCYEATVDCSSPLTAAANSIMKLQDPMQRADREIVKESLKRNADKIKQNDFSGLEDMLSHQANMLHMIFARAVEGIAGGYLEKQQFYGNLAMKSQNLCRMTIEAIADMKNPNRITVIKNTAVNQQVNFKSLAKTTNELLNEGINAPLDSRGTTAAGTANPAMATVENSRH